MLLSVLVPVLVPVMAWFVDVNIIPITLTKAMLSFSITVPSFTFSPFHLFTFSDRDSMLILHNRIRQHSSPALLPQLQPQQTLDVVIREHNIGKPT